MIQSQISNVLEVHYKKRNNFLIILFLIGISNLIFAQMENDLKTKNIEINGVNISYLEKGTGDPILFFHGVPSNSEIWREIMDSISKNGQTIALDLPGYGKSGIAKNNDFSIQSQFSYIKGFIDALQLKNITIVVHDLGSLYGIKYAVENQENIKQIVLLESVFMPTNLWYKQLPISAKLMFVLFKNPKRAQKWLVEKDVVPSMMLKSGTIKRLNKTELKKYTASFDKNRERKIAFLNGPNPATMPKKGISLQKGDFADEFTKNAEGLKKLSETKPILILYANPGMITQKKAIDYAKTNFKNLTIKNIGKGKHFLQIDHPKKISAEINDWLNNTQK